MLSPIKIGDHTLPNNAFLAPLSGITDKSFRTISARFGAGMVVSEMIASAALTNGHKDMARRLGRPEKLPHIVQLAGCEPHWLAEGARIAEDAGADIIDINMGCPLKARDEWVCWLCVDARAGQGRGNHKSSGERHQQTCHVKNAAGLER